MDRGTAKRQSDDWKSCNLIGQFPGLRPRGDVRLGELRQATEGRERVCQRKEEVCSPNLLHFFLIFQLSSVMRKKGLYQLILLLYIWRGVKTHICYMRHTRHISQMQNYWHFSWQWVQIIIHFLKTFHLNNWRNYDPFYITLNPSKLFVATLLILKNISIKYNKLSYYEKRFLRAFNTKETLSYWI